MDIVVFNQSELDEAIASGETSILLCDNDFNIPLKPDICYRAVGSVRAVINTARSVAEGRGIVFHDFSPEYTQAEAPAYAHVPHGIHPAIPARLTGSYGGSFSSSYGGSYSGSYTGSFSGMYEYEYEFGGSYGGSFSSSYGGSFSGSFSSSFGTSSCGAVKRLGKKYKIKEISINGYGIELI